MKSFKTFLVEGANELPPQLKKYFKDYNISLFKSSSKSKTFKIITSEDREDTKRKLENILSPNFEVESSLVGGSVGSTIVKLDGINYKFLYKPPIGKGGRGDSTLNSTITELAPALAFNKGKKFVDINTFMEFLSTVKTNAAYISNGDQKSGTEFIYNFRQSKHFEEKMENAIAILNYLYDEHKRSPIKEVYWGYRAKPVGVHNKHKGDIFIKYKNGDLIGVSLKAGALNSKEPKFNTTVSVLTKHLNIDIEKLDKQLFNRVLKKIGLDKRWNDSRAKLKDSVVMLRTLAKDEPELYHSTWIKTQEFVKMYIIKDINKNKNTELIKKWIKHHILNSTDVPLVLVKAIGRTYNIITKNDDLSSFLPSVIKISSTNHDSNKAFWYIHLHSKTEKLTLTMSTRTSKPPPYNKIAQAPNLRTILVDID
jgi:hypothetical protein